MQDEPATDRDRLPELVVAGVAVGVVAGFGAWLFRTMIALVHNLAFQGTLSTTYDANVHTPAAPWGLGLILVPVAGAVIVVAIVENFAPEARGHGVPEVLDAIYYRQGRIRPQVAVFKSLASAVSIGTGGSVGREGPIAQIGSAFGSTLGQWRRFSPDQVRLLVAAGAAAGIGATFDAPIGGVLFAVELMMLTVTPVTLVVVTGAVVTAVAISQRLLGLAFAFPVLSLQQSQPLAMGWPELAVLVPVGLLMGMASAGFIVSLAGAERFFPARLRNPYLRHMFGMSMVGVLIYVTYRLRGAYTFEGVGYATIIDIIDGVLTNPWLLIVLALGKWFATITTLGSGASGGVFSPALFMGAALGGAAGHIAVSLGVPVDPAVVALAGMAGMVAGSTGAVLTAITMTGEMTGDFGVAVALLVTAGLAAGVRSVLLPVTIYTEKLIGRHHWVPQGLQGLGLDRVRARDLAVPLAETADVEAAPDAPPSERLSPEASVFDVVAALDRVPEVHIVDGEEVIGRVTHADLDDGLIRHGLVERPRRPRRR